ncbi:hypothetical protein C7293_14220 [filamentous cyanobacterium CCT1]|nr:hypothetical protein C7293_14220 [filamentous cyanobacterium CCT1]PSN77945.1 hypothetical protein C8B47_19455 [filamentous cyanobacterium CCP4]
MDEREIHEKYVTLFDQLKFMIENTHSRVIASDSDPLFEENINFFAKSFLISMCAYLESYLKDIAFSRIKRVDEKLAQISIPYNLVRWEILRPKEKIEEGFRFQDLRVSIKKKDLDDHISANPYRTESLFKRLGIDLPKSGEFNSKRDLVTSIVAKRNKIVHHNDSASDISMIDLHLYVDSFVEYMEIITSVVEQENSRQ